MNIFVAILVSAWFLQATQAFSLISEEWQLANSTSGNGKNYTLTLQLELLQNDSSQVLSFGGGVVTSQPALEYNFSLSFAPVSGAFELIPLLYSSTYRNSYELSDGDEACPISFNVGECYEANTMPSDDTWGKYNLCCLQSTRRFGMHCLRQSENYYTYHASSKQIPISKWDIGVSGSFEGESELLALLKTTSIEDALSNNVTLFEDCAIDALFLLNESAYDTVITTLKSKLLIVSSANVSGLPNWFYSNDKSLPSPFGITGAEWFDTADCTQKMDSQTRTHLFEDHLEDQFYALKQNTLLDLLSSTGGWDPEVNISNDGDSDTFDPGTSGVGLRLAPEFGVRLNVTVLITIPDT